MTAMHTPDGQTVTLPAPFVLPTPPSALRGALASVKLAPLSASEKAYTMYGGSTMNWALDGARRWFLGCNAVNSTTDLFAFYVFLLQNGAMVNIPIPFIGEGRGWLDVEPDGIMYCGAWNKGYFVPPTGPTLVPGAAPWPAGAGGSGGGYVIAPKGSVRVFMDTDGFNGQQLVNLAAAGIPPASALNVRLALDAEAGRLLRCGPPVADPTMQAAAMLTVTALGLDQRAYESGVVSTTPSRTLLVATERGSIAAGFVDVMGWWG
jgi:hypothetical protein